MITKFGDLVIIARPCLRHYHPRAGQIRLLKRGCPVQLRVAGKPAAVAGLALLAAAPGRKVPA
jgi:hypothetical protein